MSEFPGASGLILNEPLLWEKEQKGRCAYSLPRQEVEPSELPAGLEGQVPDLPELSELDLVRHYTRLSQWNLGVDSATYPLGSCTMKYNPRINESLAALPGLAGAHPLLPAGLCQGALHLMHELEGFLSEITGMDATSLQPSAGAQGELTGILLIKAWLQSRGEQRSKILVPDTAHGTNPASAALCGLKAVPVASGPGGILLSEAVDELMDADTAGIMVTNPNTLGLFEQNIKEIAAIVHERGGQVYCDGANLNALMGMVKMGRTGVDVVHLNLHKTFSAPHGGGGPGSGPVCVGSHLEPFLPVPRLSQDPDGGFGLDWDQPDSVGKVHAFWGNFGVMVRAYSYILSMGPADLKRASQLAVLNANYLKERLNDTLELGYDQPCLHECVFKNLWQQQLGVSTLDIAKRLIDYGFHPPTVYFPLVVPDAIMIEPTETESKDDLDKLVAAFREIAEQAEKDPAALHESPVRTKLKRLDETRAARKPCLIG